MVDLCRRIDQYLSGERVDFDADISDVGTAMLERSRIYRQWGMDVRIRGQVDFALFWALNANSQTMLFWFLALIYSTPGLADRLRKEIAPHVTLAPPGISAIDIQGLYRDCPLFKSTLFETFRLKNEPTSIRYVAKPVVAVDSNRSHQLTVGSWLSIPHMLCQHNPAVFPEPDKFIPDRFTETDPVTGRQDARYGRMRPWGHGVPMCKGRTFAEKEILTDNKIRSYLVKLVSIPLLSSEFPC
jgi:cytochrome P450